MKGARIVVETVTGPWEADEREEVERVGRLISEALMEENYLGLVVVRLEDSE